MTKYTVQTDGFLADELEAQTLDAAIAEAFDGEGLGRIVDEGSLYAKFEKYVADGGWCRIECDGEEVLSIGER
jgi:hypothetical protein